MSFLRYTQIWRRTAVRLSLCLQEFFDVLRTFVPKQVGEARRQIHGVFRIKSNTRGRINSIFYSFFCPETKEPKILRSKGEMTRHQSHQKPSCQRVCVTSLLCRGGLPLSTRVSIYKNSNFHSRENNFKHNHRCIG